MANTSEEKKGNANPLVSRLPVPRPVVTCRPEAAVQPAKAPSMRNPRIHPRASLAPPPQLSRLRLCENARESGREKASVLFPSRDLFPSRSFHILRLTRQARRSFPARWLRGRTRQGELPLGSQPTNSPARSPAKLLRRLSHLPHSIHTHTRICTHRHTLRLRDMHVET